jgi:hypothetical protein
LSSSLPSSQTSDHEQINSYLVCLKAIGIAVKPRDKTWSPSTSFQNLNKSESLAGDVKFLYYKDPFGLAQAISSLETRFYRGEPLTHEDVAAVFGELRHRILFCLGGSPEAVLSPQAFKQRLRGLWLVR